MKAWEFYSDSNESRAKHARASAGQDTEQQVSPADATESEYHTQDGRSYSQFMKELDITVKPMLQIKETTDEQAQHN